ncbi:hypothetical protein [Sphingobacterium paucimobilis]|uniref:tRNA (Guanine-N1)-methyltransferase n=1 Tax=Sphingobacterium paucimobilis HER1398 TaxID=1346330 RepID=U2HA20_9SPHI|nr:hypothetical protein [Sphingobacterium paucimobilis]ERJ58571.1 hypothetical protein M472_07315 [Sphingobacterium paucimobilis HER1398]
MHKSILSLVFLFLATSTFAQLTLQQKLQSDLNLNTQFQVLLAQSRSQDADFKIVRKSNIEIIQKNVNDSISKYTKEIASLKSSSSSSIATVTGLKDSLHSVQSELLTEKQKTDSISFIGIDFAKSAYHMMVWIIIAVLGIGFFTMLVSFRKAKVDTVEHQKTAEETQNEFQQYKKKAMEKEQLLKRQLLDEQLKRDS